MRIRTFQKYIAAGFWAPFFLGLAVFCLLLVFGTVIDRLNFLMRSGAGAGDVAVYILCQVPYFVVKMMPVATLLAALFAIGGMVSRGEWKAGMAGGWRPFDMIKPLFACALLVGAAQFLLQETAAPGLFMRAEYMFEEPVISGDWRQVVKRDVAFSAGGEKFLSASVFNGREKRMERVILSVYKEGRLNKEYNSAYALWNQRLGRWVFSDVVQVSYRNGSAPALSRYPSLVSDVAVPPEDLVIERLVPDGIAIPDLLRRTRRLGQVGAPTVAERTLFWIKLAAPFANPVMVLIGAAMALLIRGGNRFLSFGYALGAGFFFWAVIIMGQEAGNSELLPPAVAGLAPVLLFGAVSLWGMRRARGL